MVDSHGSIAGVVDSVNRRFVRFFDMLETKSNNGIYLMFLSLTLIIIIPILIAYEFEEDSTRYEHKDLDIFRDRAETILEGDLLYRDTEHVTLSPPLINYLFVPAVLLGNTALVWTCWFATFIFISSVVLYHILLGLFDKRYAIAGAVFFITSPFSNYTTIMMQLHTLRNHESCCIFQ